MTRKPGAISGRSSEGLGPRDPRWRRNAQRGENQTGSGLGAGLRLDSQGRLSVRAAPALDPNDPDFNAKLVALLQAAGLMEK